MLPLNLPELEVSGLALVTAMDDCPPIAVGEGSVVTARFVTREVHVVASRSETIPWNMTIMASIGGDHGKTRDLN